MKWVREDLVSKRMRLYDKGRSFCVRPKVLTIYTGRKTENKKKQKKTGKERNSGWKPKWHVSFCYINVSHIYGLLTGVMHFFSF